MRVNDIMYLEITNIVEMDTNVDFTLTVETTYGETKLFLQPEINNEEVTNITSPDANDDSFLIHERYHKEILAAMQQMINEI